MFVEHPIEAHSHSHYVVHLRHKWTGSGTLYKATCLCYKCFHRTQFKFNTIKMRSHSESFSMSKLRNLIVKCSNTIIYVFRSNRRINRSVVRIVDVVRLSRFIYLSCIKYNYDKRYWYFFLLETALKLTAILCCQFREARFRIRALCFPRIACQWVEVT